MTSIPFDGGLATKSALPRAARQVNTAGCFNRVPPVIPAAHPSFPRSLSPAPIGERESIPQLTRHSRQACPRPRSGSGNPSRRSPVFPTKLVPGPDLGAGIHPAAHPSFPRSLSPAPIGEREPIPPLTRPSREACPRPRSGSGNPSRRSPVFPVKLVPGPDRGAGIHPAAHPSFPSSLSPAPIGERESIPPLTRLSRAACPRPRSGSGNPSRRSPVFPAQLVPGPDRGAGIHPAAHPSFLRSLSPAPIGERESIPPLTRLSCAACPRPRSGSGNPSRRSPVFPAQLVPGPDRGAGIHPAAPPSFPAKLVPGPDRGAGIHPAAHPSFPVKLVPGPDRGAGIHPAAHPSFP